MPSRGLSAERPACRLEQPGEGGYQLLDRDHTSRLIATNAVSATFGGMCAKWQPVSSLSTLGIGVRFGARALQSPWAEVGSRPPLFPSLRFLALQHDDSDCMNSAAEAVIDTPDASTSVEYQFPRFRSIASASSRAHSAPSGRREIDAVRALNVLVAAVALVLCAPLMLLIGMLVKLSSPGPVIYKQTRVGLDRRGGDDSLWKGRRKVDYGGRLFTMYKFRTMRADADQALQVWACPGDVRITAIGRLLRACRLDELPQLFNVLKGDMNVVGPRPEQPKLFLDLREQVEGYAERQRVLPGITGWAQINQSYDTCVEDVRSKVRFDLDYIQRRSWRGDLKIIVRTLPVIVFRKGAL